MANWCQKPKSAQHWPRGNSTVPPKRRVAFFDTFSDDKIDETKWLPQYLPHWTTPGLAKPRYHFEEGNLILRLDVDQDAWCPEHDGDVKCSSIQTGHFSGGLGTARGQLRFSKNLRVQTALPKSELFLPLHGYFEVRAKAKIASNNMVAFWMMGFEELPENSGEITVMEIFGKNCTAQATRFGHGVKQATDPRLLTEYHDDLLNFDVADWHTYGVEWTKSGTDHFIDGNHLCHINHAPQYPLQFMLGIYELPNEPKPHVKQTATFTIDYVKAYSPSE